MSAFSDQSWETRYASMGDASEKRFEEYMEGRFERWGINRPDIHVPSLPARVRAAPDYLVTDPEPAFVECMGIGRKQKLQVKLEKFGVLRYWNDLLPVKVWVYDSHRKRSGLIDLDDLDYLIQRPEQTEFTWFDGKKLVFTVPADDIFALAA